MNNQKAKNLELYFDDPRLKMTLIGRFMVRVSTLIGYLVLFAAFITLLISDLKWFKGLGVFLGLVIVDILIHLREADRPLSELPKKGRVNLKHVLSPIAFSVLEKAYEKSLVTKQNIYLETCRQTLNFEEVEDGLERLDIKFKEFKQKNEDLLSQSAQTDSINKEEQRKKVENLIILALGEAIDAGRRFIDLVSLFSALLKINDEYTNRLFNLFSIEAGDLERALILGSVKKRFSGIRRIPATLSGFIFESEREIRHRIMNRAWTSRPTPTLDHLSVDLTDAARQEQIGFLIGHETEYQRMVDTLARPINPNIILVGEPGIGKETIVNHLAFKMTKDEVPEAIFDKRLVSLSIANLVAGAPPEELQDRLRKIIEEIVAAGNIILYIPDIHNLVKTSGESYISAADALMPIILSNTFPIIGTTYPKEFKQYVESRSDFASAFEIIRVNEIGEAEAEKVLAYESLILEQRARILISFGAIKTAVKVAKKYLRNKYLPSSASELLKKALVIAQRQELKRLGPDQIISAAEEESNIPIHEVTATEAQELLNLEEKIHQRLIDQEEAVKAVSDALREYRSGLTNTAGPIAAFLFVGPTGVGKTELSKILTKIQFGSESAMIRFDMSEYQDKQSFYRFIGSPDGKISGALTDAVLQKPYSLILLDEFEKAYPDILNLFLQVFDDGRLTDNLSRTVDFKNTIIIATSNAHSDIINESLRQGETMTAIAEYLKKRLVDVFRPELLNRFSRVVVFKDLSPSDISKISEINLKDLAATLNEQGIVLTFDPEVVKKIAKLGYDPSFGARPLKRVINDQLKAPLARKILEKNIKKGGRIKISLENDDFAFAVLE